jgi:hypothetical protein
MPPNVVLPLEDLLTGQILRAHVLGLDVVADTLNNLFVLAHTVLDHLNLTEKF